MERHLRRKTSRRSGARVGASILLGLFLAVLAFTNPFFFGVVGAIQEAHAEEKMWQATVGPPVKVRPCGTVMNAAPGLGLCTDVGQAQAIQDRVENAIYFHLLSAAIYGFLDAATYMAQTIAYDTASWIAEGGPASGPLFYGKDFGDYLGDTAKNALGEFVGTLSTDFTSQFGLNLCKPPNWQELNLQLALSIPDLMIPLKRPTPKCPWSVLVQNWDTAASSFSNADALANIGATFQMGGNDLSYAIAVHGPLLDAVAGKEQGAILDRLEGAGYKSVKDYVTGNIKTPSDIVRKQFDQQLITGPAQTQNIKTSAIVMNAFELGFVEIGKATLSTFVNTLASKLLSKVMKGIFQPSTQGSDGAIDFTNPFAAPAQSTQPRQIFSEQFKDILTPKLSSSEEENILAELQASCSGAGRTKWSCAIDANLALALTQGGMTVREALDKGFINPNAQLVPSSDIEQNRDPTCAANGDRFCIANLRKLRLARIVPIGWELAADSPTNHQRCTGGQGCITIGEVIAKFDDCNYDTASGAGGSAAGTLDAAHPWCHLIDPNWVLASFPSKCMVKGYGNTLLAGTSDRLFECQDSVSCLRRDADGKCVGGYGYCLAEQPYWQFEAQSCKEQFTSCRMFTPRGGNAKPIGYLRSTLDYGNCNASNVGCMWYATTRNPSAGENAWTATYAGAAGKVYFDTTMAACDAKNDGCTELKTVIPGVHAVNLLQNGSFEIPEADISGELFGWRRLDNGQIADGTHYTSLNDTAPSVTEGDSSADGSRAVVPPSMPELGQLVRFDSSHQYTVSLYARRGAAAPSSAGLMIQFYSVSGNDPNAQPSKRTGALTETNFYKSSGCATIPVVGGGMNHAQILIPSTIGIEWQRFECSFVPPANAAWGIVSLSAGGGSAPLIDAVKLEESEVATPFGEGLNPDLQTVNMMIPPSELGCTGEETDHPLCASYARVCRANEAGCQGYRLKRQSGSPEIPAVLSPVDTCPAECVGYGEFRKQPSTFDYTRNPSVPLLNDPNDETVAYFVPNTARFCTAADVGCEQFTNLGAAGQGGDTAGAFSWLRSCQQPSDAAQTFYTWEGSEDTGYQLRTWSMVRDLTAPAPQGPRTIEKPGPDGVLKAPADCNAATYTSAFDADCRQFYDPQGNVFYRFESQAVLSDPLCQQYRLDRSSDADCTLTGGSFNAQTNTCTYEALGSQSKSCPQAVAGCRGYVGTAGKSQALVYSEEFSDDASLANFIVNNGATLSRSEESVLVGDSSLRVVPGANGWFSFTVPTEPGVLYEISFWAKRAGAPQNVNVSAIYDDVETAIGTPSISSEWGVYRLGPWVGDAAGAGDRTEISFGNFGNAVTFIDKIRVERVSDVTYVIKNSWQTPASCDRTPEGIPEPHAMLGCDAYTDRNGKEANIRQFSRLCREKSIGCTGYVNTENTETPYESRWTKTGAGNTVETTVKPGDHYSYYIPAKAKMCPESAKGCRAFGLPQFTQNRLALKSPTSTVPGEAEEPYKTVYLKDNPAQYDEGLCSEPELFCESYAYNAAGQAGTAYFRAPSNHACEWKEGVVLGQTCNLANAAQLAGRTYDGWFKTGTDCPCYPDRLITGSVFGLRYTGDAGYNAWTGADQTLYGGAPQTYQAWTATCLEPQAECTEFRDPNDASDPLHPMGRPYFVINDSRLDKESCNGQVDPGNGCVLFLDTSDSRLSYSSAATEAAYRERAYRPVGPVDCVGQPNHPACAAAVEGRGGVPAYCDDRDGAPVCVGLSRSALTVCITGHVNQTGPVHICNDTNIIVKVKPDRACSQWLACRTGETTYDEVDGTFKNICSDLALCNASGETGAEGVPFCTSYVNRSVRDLTIFQPYRVTDAATYASRPVGFGSVDYGGLTIPEHFQVMDTLLKPIGSFISTDPRIASALKKDYRLAVAVPMSSGLARRPTAPETAAIAQSPELMPYVCIFVQTGAYGLVTTKSGVLAAANNQANPDSNNICWLSVDQEKPPAIGGVASTIVSDNLVVPFLEKRFTQDEYPSLDPTLSRAFPNTQCKASPESNAPFGNAYVLEWDDSVNPPQPKYIKDGYANANFCEYGEDCECVYKRVGYKGPVKYYSPLSTDVVNAICQGGPREGLPCIADVSIQGSEPPAGGSSTGTTAVNYQPSHAKPDRQCGSGTCTPISEATLVRGMTGQCLQYDISRPRGGGSGQDECLLWNPNPILTGPGDQYHWQPTAGFQPPQSSGRYYCTSPIRNPRSQSFWAASWIPKDVPQEGFNWDDFALAVNPMTATQFVAYQSTETTLSLLASPILPGSSLACGDNFNCRAGVGFRPNSAGNFAGSMRALFYADWFTSDGSCVNFLFVGGCTGGQGGATLDGTTAEGTTQGDACESIDDEDQDYIYKTDAMRLVTTAQGTNRSYAEYAFLINPVDVAYAALGYKPTDPETVFDFSMEDSIANFEFAVPPGKIGCGYSEEWADGAHVDDYDSGRDQWGGPDTRWHASFLKYLQDGGGNLDRKNAQVVTEDGSPSGIPVKVGCVVNDPDRAPEEGCYIKTWELDYRAEGQDKFLAFSPGIGRESLDRLSTHPIYGKCESSHPWFAIRAVFEDTNETENESDPLEIRPEQLTGPFQLVGLWVSSCAPGDQSKYIYMTMKMNSADVCRELAETISKDSHDSAAFTDRNSAESGYALKNGFSWNTTNIPFGASLANGDAGDQPLYMSGVRQSEVNPLNPPTFTYPGQTYFQTSRYPTSNWGLLSNVFARIYRIYGYSAHGVTRSDHACTNRQSPQFGQWCPDLSRVGGIGTESAAQVQARLSRQYCGYGGTCVKGSLNAANLFATKACNSFSGVNRGLDCSADPDICHIAPMEERDGVPTPIYSACELFQGYTPVDAQHGTAIAARWAEVGRNYRCQGANCPAGSNCTWDGTAGSASETGCSRAEAVRVGAFRCAAGSVRAPDQVRQSINGTETYASYCTRPSLQGEPSHECAAYHTETCTNGTCGGSPWAQCNTSADCTFEARNWWPSGDSNNRFETVSVATPWGNQIENQAAFWGTYLGYFDKNFSTPHTAYPAGRGWFLAQSHLDNTVTGQGLEAVENKNAALSAFYPAVPYDLQTAPGVWAWGDDSYSRIFPTWISPSRITANGGSASLLTYHSWDDFDQMALQPGFNPLIFSWGDASNDDSISPGYVSFNIQQANLAAPLTLTVNNATPPYVSYARNANWAGDAAFGREDAMFANYGACESVALMFRNTSQGASAIAGICRGGSRAGAACSGDADCIPASVDNSLSETWCNPVTSGSNTDPDLAYGYTAQSADCWPNGSDITNPRHPRTETDTELDLNICTHPAGYWPRPNYCLNPNDEYCGLFGYDLSTLNASVNDTPPLPTDVTAGLYTPRFLNPASFGPGTTINYNYVDFYNPQPPHTAAPDVRACQGQRCRVTGLDTLSLDGTVGGMANGGVGSHVGTLRFYAWASHEQMPLRRVIVDWGDGAISELPDAFMKNRKPFCGTSKECTLTPGLTCETDNDCPPGGGSCESYGNCTNSPNLKCYNDVQCALGGEQGVCEKRTYFGNSQDACDERYLEFRHAYACPADAATLRSLPACTGRRCLRNNNQTCTANADCGVGDSCIDGMAQSTGCYDVANNRCLFTPRVMIVDNWGWCSGECRNSTNSVGGLIDSGSFILHPNGGCYDASNLRSNANMLKFVGVAQGSAGINECSTVPSNDRNRRPWVVYPGSLQLLPGEAL